MASLVGGRVPQGSCVLPVLLSGLTWHFPRLTSFHVNSRECGRISRMSVKGFHSLGQMQRSHAMLYKHCLQGLLVHILEGAERTDTWFVDFVLI